MTISLQFLEEQPLVESDEVSMIDVIIPVYNTEKYIRRCIDSILAQTYPDFHLILVDDGSTDNSGVLCDEYSSAHVEIVVIHQSNGGLSSARNAGLEWVFAHSDSKWITFIDSDDWWRSDYLASLLYAAENAHTKISLCEYACVNGENDSPEPLVEDVKIMSAESLYCERNTTSVTAWGKLYAKELWYNQRFPVGKIHEDEFVIYKILFSVGNIAYISTPLYYYFANPDGITRSEWTPAKLAGLEAKQEQIRYMQVHGYPKAFRQAVLSYAEVARWQLSQIDKEKYPDEAKKLSKQLRKHIFRYKRSGVFSRRKTREIYKTAFPLEMKILDRLYTMKNSIHNHFICIHNKPHVMDAKTTIRFILENNCSVARYGDGEYLLMTSSSDIGFQKNNAALCERLHDVLNTPHENCLICIPDVFGSLKIYHKKALLFWKDWRENFMNRSLSTDLFIDNRLRTYLFGNSLFTRPYIDYPDEKNAMTIFPLIRKLWENKDILIAEGNQTRLGINNDLLDNAASVQRILAPAVNAFDKYSEILSAIEKYAGDRLILLALGPTATVLACDLSRHGFRAIDIGHIDIEYEWFLTKAKEKVPIPGKYTHEAEEGRTSTVCDNPDYISQIIRIIE